MKSIAWCYQEMQVYSHMMQFLHMDTNTTIDTTDCIAQLFTYFLDPSQYNKLKHTILQKRWSKL